MKLFVDDLRDPWNTTWDTARSYPEAVACIQKYKNEITHLSLDNDLGTQKEGKDIIQVLKAMDQEGSFKLSDLTVYIHTGSPAAGKCMMDALDGRVKDVQFTDYFFLMGSDL